jgi:ATP-dependent exoDNAse (exonuclease V) alpha subunit
VIRARLRQADVLTGPDHVIVVGDASGCSYRLHLAVGDKIRFGIRQDRIGAGVINGTVGRIEKVEELDGQHLFVQAVVDGRTVEFSTEALKDGAGRVRLSHDLAVTAYSAQGLTAETATVVLGSEYDRHQSYVAVSRARGETRIFYDKSLLSAQAKGEQELRAQQVQSDNAAEMTYLAAKLSRANLKTSTLALTGDAEIFREQRRRERDRNALSI